MPFKPHPTDPDKLVFVANQYDLSWLEAPINITEEPMRTWLWDRNYSVIDTDDLKKLMQQKEWQGLGTDEEILELSKDAWGRDKLTDGRTDLTGFYVDFARLIEKTLKEKNT